MKKNGFTLAEVLITLAIIGVVATLTLPALLTNTQEQQSKTALKKGINTLTEMAQMNQAMTGFDYGSITSDDTTKNDDETQSLYSLLANRGSIDFSTSKKGALKGQSSADNFVVFFRDGSALSFLPANTKSTAVVSGTTKVADVMSDGLPYGYPALYDYNGTKGPNILSNCEGKMDATNDTDDIKNCNDKTKRIIKDQFGVRLRGGYAVPNGAAARWAFENK